MVLPFRFLRHQPMRWLCTQGFSAAVLTVAEIRAAMHAPLVERLVRAAVFDQRASLLVLNHPVFPSVASVARAAMRFSAFRGEVRSAARNQKLAKMTGN